MLLGVVVLIARQNIESHAAKTLGQFLGIACESQHGPVQEFVVMHSTASARMGEPQNECRCKAPSRVLSKRCKTR